MKKFILMLIALVTVACTFTSCDDDLDSNSDVSLYFMGETIIENSTIGTTLSYAFAKTLATQQGESYSGLNAIILHKTSLSSAKSAITKAASTFAQDNGYTISDANNYTVHIIAHNQTSEKDEVIMNLYFK